VSTLLNGKQNEMKEASKFRCIRASCYWLTSRSSNCQNEI